MDKSLKSKLLSNPTVREEIGKHLWIESEKAKRDIGFDCAAEDWFAKFGDKWAEKNLPKEKPAVRSFKR